MVKTFIRYFGGEKRNTMLAKLCYDTYLLKSEISGIPVKDICT